MFKFFMSIMFLIMSIIFLAYVIYTRGIKKNQDKSREPHNFKRSSIEVDEYIEKKVAEEVKKYIDDDKE